MVSEQFDSGRMTIGNVPSQSEDLESGEDLGYVEAKLEKIQEHLGSINRDMQTMKKMMERLIKLQEDKLKKMNRDDSYSGLGRNPEIRIGNNRDLLEKEMNGENLEKENRREITGKRDEDRSDENLGRTTISPPLSPSSPRSKFSPPSPSTPYLPSQPPAPPLPQSPKWPPLLPLSQFPPLLDHTEFTKRVSIVGTRSTKETEKLPKSNLGSLFWPKPYSNILIWPKPGLNLMRPLNFATYSIIVMMNNTGGVTDDLRKLPPPVPPPRLLPSPVPPPLLSSLPSPLLPPSVKFHYISSLPCSIGEARACLFDCSSYFSSIMLGYKQPRSYSLETWVMMVQGTPISGASEYRRSRHKEDFPAHLPRLTLNHRDVFLQHNFSITLGDFSCSGNRGLSAGGPEMVDDLMISAEGPNVDEQLSYAKTYTKLRWNRDFDPYFHDPSFTFSPKVVQLHQNFSGQGLTVSSSVRLLQWQEQKKQHEKFKSLDLWGDLQAGRSVNQSLEVDETWEELDCQSEDDESTRPAYEAKGNRLPSEPNGELKDISIECVWFKGVPKRFVEDQFNKSDLDELKPSIKNTIQRTQPISISEVVGGVGESTRLKDSPDPFSVRSDQEHFDGDIGIRRICEVVEKNVERQTKSLAFDATGNKAAIICKGFGIGSAVLVSLVFVGASVSGIEITVLFVIGYEDTLPGLTEKKSHKRQAVGFGCGCNEDGKEESQEAELFLESMDGSCGNQFLFDFFPP